MTRNDPQQKRRKSLLEFVTRLGSTSNVVDRRYLDTVSDTLMNGGESTDMKKLYLLSSNPDFASLWDSTRISLTRKWLQHRLAQTHYTHLTQEASAQNWHAQVNDSSLCANYKLFKNEFKIEHYLCTLEKRYTIKLCKFRAGDYKLPVTLERYSRQAKQEMLCKCVMQAR